MSLPNDPPTSKAEGQSSRDWRNELKRRIEAHQQRKEDPRIEADLLDASSEAVSQATPAETSSQAPQASRQPTQAPLQPQSEELHLPRSEEEEETLGSAGSLETGAFETGPADPDEDLRHADFSTQDPFPVQPPFENGESDGSVERSLDPAEFSGTSRQQIVTFSEKATLSTPPLDREISLSLPASAPAPVQGDNGAPDEDFPDEGSSGGGADWISREIFLSRLLAGLVDLLLSSFVGLIFGWVASTLLGFDFFSASSIEIALATGLLFYWVSSVFFLSLTGQTPGMHLTGLQLLYQGSSELPFMAVFIRVLAILPVIVTVAGLLWGLFDPWGRCLHDRISQTRVASVPD